MVAGGRFIDCFFVKTEANKKVTMSLNLGGVWYATNKESRILNGNRHQF